MYVPRPIVYIAGAILGVQAAILSLASLFLLLVAIGNALVGTYDETPELTFQNTTDTPLCLYSAECDADILPGERTTIILDSCFSSTSIELFANGRPIYGRFANCTQWDGALLLINERNDEFVVADDLPSNSYQPPPN